MLLGLPMCQGDRVTLSVTWLVKAVPMSSAAALVMRYRNIWLFCDRIVPVNLRGLSSRTRIDNILRGPEEQHEPPAMLFEQLLKSVRGP